ncbi:hypothetical protein COP2_044822 [Malus domestica]
MGQPSREFFQNLGLKKSGSGEVHGPDECFSLRKWGMKGEESTSYGHSRGCMSLCEQCSKVERSVLADDDLLEVLVEKDDIRAYLYEIANNEMITIHARRARTPNHDSGS